MSSKLKLPNFGKLEIGRVPMALARILCTSGADWRRRCVVRYISVNEGIDEQLYCRSASKPRRAVLRDWNDILVTKGAANGIKVEFQTFESSFNSRRLDRGPGGIHKL